MLSQNFEFFLESDSEPEYVFTIANLSGLPTLLKCQVNIAGHSTPVMVDSGASVNILDAATCSQITHSDRIKLHLTRHETYSDGSPSALPLKEVITADISTDLQHLSPNFMRLTGTPKIC